MSGVEQGGPLQEASATLLEVHGLCKHFGARPGIDELSLSVGPGEIVGLVGPKGSGKTILLRILAGLLPPDAGRGTILGFDLLREPRDIRRRVGYLSRHDPLYGTLSVQENLSFRAEALGLRDRAKAVSTAIEQFGLQPFTTQPAERLSSAWARTLQLSIALVHEPRLVMLDEPTAGLDVAARRAVWHHLRRLADEGRAVLLSTHDLLDISRCSRIVPLSQSRIRTHGSPSDLVQGMLTAASAPTAAPPVTRPQYWHDPASTPRCCPSERA